MVIHRVTKWPGQEAHQQQSKIPTLVWYDANQKAVALGAEALLDDVEEQAEDNCWFLSKHFKLHLHPDDLKTKHNLKLDALPPGVNLQQIYSDFLRYLLKHTKTYFEDRVLDGKRIWEKYSPKMEVILAHPNGWGIKEQVFLRSAAVSAGLAGDDTASSKIRFVTEAEASVHFCIHYANMKNVLKSGANFAVCDAGGSTVDTTLYSVVSASPLKIKEQRDSACVQAGAIFVDFEMEKYLESTLAKAELDPEDVEFYTKTGLKDFESYAKKNFRSKAVEYAVMVADSRFSNPAIHVRRGRMMVPGSIIQNAFDPCVTEIKQSLDRQLNGMNVPHLLLVGGFSDSGYVRNELKQHYEPRGSKLVMSNDSSSKAVADGAVIWGASCNVVSRAPRSSFGISVYMPYRPLIDDPAGRIPFTSLSGEVQVTGGWSEVVHKGIPIEVGVVYRKDYQYLYNTPTLWWSKFEADLIAYSGDDTPEWAEDPHRELHWNNLELCQYLATGKLLNGFRNACTISGDLQDVQNAMLMRTNPSGSKYWVLKFTVCIRFSGTELESFLEWEENGIKRTGAALIVLPEEITLN
ncbi:unnamed protein product [Rhizoctonia solani]|uniref:Heat shock 70 kDa protein 12A n=1 Tax=Rhizoctonia solani TaxID=456999 RepID=A0A8H3E3W4_9AGAM|nr:unnamed protein product [Rhizoctonia solani]